MPKSTAKVINTLVRPRHKSIRQERVEAAVVATVASAHFGDDTDEAKCYLVVVGDCANVAKRVFQNAAIYIDPQLVLDARSDEDVCLLAFCEQDDMLVAYSGLKEIRRAAHSSFWRVVYEHVSARDMAEA